MKNPETHLYTLWRKQRRLRTQLVIVIVIIIGLGLWLKPHIFPAKHSSITSSVSSTTTSLAKGTPEFKTFLPEGDTINDYGGWTRVSPSSSEPVYAYTATLYGTAIIVSQQKLPDDFANDVKGKIQELQSDQGYTTQHTVDVNGTTVYVGISKDNYQSSIFESQGTMVLITSYRLINDTSMGGYVQSLQ